MVYLNEKEPSFNSEGYDIKERGVSSIVSSILSNSLSCISCFNRNKFDSVHLNESDCEYEEEFLDDDDNEDPEYVRKSVVAASTSSLSVQEKLQKLRSQMRDNGIAVYIVASGDEHQSEYTALADKRREFITGFTGSAGVAVISLTDPDSLSGEAALSTDGRYFIQAGQQLDQRYWKLIKEGITGYPPWKDYAISLATKSKFSNVLSLDPNLVSYGEGEFFRKKESESKTFQFFPFTKYNLVDKVWGVDHPSRPKDPVFHLPLKYSGQHTNAKVEAARNILLDKYQTQYLIVTALDDIAWLLNLRGSDVPFSSVFFSYLILTTDSLILYIEDYKINNGSDELFDYLKSIRGLEIKQYISFYEDIDILSRKIVQGDSRIVLPYQNVTNYRLVNTFERFNAENKLIFDSVLAEMKLSKNQTERMNARIAQYKDCLSLLIFIPWLEDQLVNKKRILREYDAARKINSIRKKLPGFQGFSYEVISSTGANTALPHYAPSKNSSAVINPSDIYLLDVGSHYLEGTTDITRTFLFSKENADKYKKYYTLVLKGHLAVALAHVPVKASISSVLDSFARGPLWNEDLDYNHGTGHGVGSFLNVHELPLIISNSGGEVGGSRYFKNGAILTIEPGYYVEGDFGIRIESEIEAERDNVSLSFKYLTGFPFERDLIDKSYLSGSEISWINRYHGDLRKEYGPALSKLGYKKSLKWLWKQTKPI